MHARRGELYSIVELKALTNRLRLGPAPTKAVELATTRVGRRRLVPRRWHVRRTRVAQQPPFVGWAPDEVVARKRRERLEWCQGLR